MIYYLLGVASGVAASYLLTHKEYRILLFSHVYDACIHAGEWIASKFKRP